MYTTTNPKEPTRETTMTLSYIQLKSLQLPTRDRSQSLRNEYSVEFRNDYSVWEIQPSSSRGRSKRRRASSSSEVPLDALQIILKRIDGLRDV